MTPFVLPAESRFSNGRYGVPFVAGNIDVALHEWDTITDYDSSRLMPKPVRRSALRADRRF
jgi:hypothetical protein